MVQVCIQGNNLNLDELPVLPPFHALYHRVAYLTATTISLVCDMSLAWMIRTKTVPVNNINDNNMELFVSPDTSDPTRIPLIATVLSALAFLPVVAVVGIVLSIQGK